MQRRRQRRPAIHPSNGAAKHVHRRDVSARMRTQCAGARFRRGKVRKRIAIGAPVGEDATPTMVGDAGRLVLVFGGDRAGDIAVVDLATDPVTSHAAKRCSP